MGHDLSPSSADDKTYNTTWLDRSGRDHSLSRFSANRIYRSGVVCNRSMRQTTRSENTLVCGYCAVGALCICVCRTDRTGSGGGGRRGSRSSPPVSEVSRPSTSGANKQQWTKARADTFRANGFVSSKKVNNNLILLLVQ